MADPFLGQIQCFGFNFAPRGWALCNGQLLQIAQNTALFSLLGTIYGGDGRTTFGLPDLQGRASMKYGTGPGLTNRRIGEKSGQEKVQLVVGDIPGHNHGATPGAANADGDVSSPTNNFPANAQNGYFSATNASMGSATSGNTGNNQPHENMQPFLVNSWCIALTGTYPQRS